MTMMQKEIMDRGGRVLGKENTKEMRERDGQRNKSRDNSREIDHYRNDISNVKYLRFSHTLYLLGNYSRYTGHLIYIAVTRDIPGSRYEKKNCPV